MSDKREVFFRAVHTINRWRKAKHDSVANALGIKRGAKALFAGNAAIDYEKQGKPLYVLVWKQEDKTGLIAKPNSEVGGEIITAEIPIEVIMRYESLGGCDSLELEEYFQNGGVASSAEAVSMPKPVVDERTFSSILTRRGQKQFREKLLRAYNGQCAITGCSVESVLEAAHIVPHSEGQSYEISNGILLRADMHTLFDLFLLSVDPGNGKIKLSPELQNCYPSLEDRLMQVPDNPNELPSASALREHYSKWKVANITK